MSSAAQRLLERKTNREPPGASSIYPLTGPAPAIKKGLLAPPLTTHLFRVQEGNCFHCLKAMHPGPYHKGDRPLGWTREHVIPRSKGGNDRLNVVLAHNKCNHDRDDRDLPLSELGRARLIILAAHIVRKREGWPWADAGVTLRATA